MTLIRPAIDADAARWLLSPVVGWWDLVRYGPPGFAAYARVSLPRDAEADQREVPDAPEDTVRAAIVTLTKHTSTPESGYAAIWEGWGSDDPAPKAPRVLIPHRTMLLFAGPVEALRDAPALAWSGSAEGLAQEPHLVWPEDKAWCLACEVDEEIEFTVGCSEHAFQALGRALPGAVRRVEYGDRTQTHRDDPV